MESFDDPAFHNFWERQHNAVGRKWFSHEATGRGIGLMGAASLRGAAGRAAIVGKTCSLLASLYMASMAFVVKPQHFSWSIKKKEQKHESRENR